MPDDIVEQPWDDEADVDKDEDLSESAAPMRQDDHLRQQKGEYHEENDKCSDREKLPSS